MHAVVLIKQLVVNVREWRRNMRKRLRGAAPVRDLRCSELREEFRAERTSLRRRSRRWYVLTRSADLVRRNRCIICQPFFRESGYARDDSAARTATGPAGNERRQLRVRSTCGRRASVCSTYLIGARPGAGSNISRPALSFVAGVQLQQAEPTSV